MMMTMTMMMMMMMMMMIEEITRNTHILWAK
jgi:hypothetical protein